MLCNCIASHCDVMSLSCLCAFVTLNKRLLSNTIRCDNMNYDGVDYVMNVACSEHEEYILMRIRNVCKGGVDAVIDFVSSARTVRRSANVLREVRHSNTFLTDHTNHQCFLMPYRHAQHEIKLK